MKTNRRVITGQNDKCNYKFEIGFTKFAGQAPYFSITGDTWELGKPAIERYSMGSGALTLGEYVPELAYLDQYHLMSTEQPMHYVANSVYHASAKDCHGLLKGEKQYKDEFVLKFEGFPFSFKAKSAGFDACLKQTTHWKAWKVQAVEHPPEKNSSYKYSPNYTFINSVGELITSEWYKCDFRDEDEAQEMFTALQTLKWSYKAVPVLYRVGEGKEPDLDAARRSACWPDAQLEDFTIEKLEARLPKLMKQFKKDLKKAGIDWPVESVEVAAV